MLKLCNASKTFIRIISDIAYTDLKKESVLSNGDKQLSFTYYGKYVDILPEYYIETADDRYVVKEVRPRMGAVEYVCKLDLEALEAFTVSQFTAKDKTVTLAANQALLSTGWTCTVDNALSSKVRSVQQFNKTPYELLLKIRDAFMCDIEFDSINKVVKFYEQMGEDKGVYMRPELNLKDVSLQLDSYDFYTRIIPVGENGLDIKSVNSGVEYVENYQYSTKVRTLYWEDTSYTSAQALKDDAVAKLADLSKPKKSYSADVRDLAKLSSDYSILDYNLGDTVTIVDEPLGISDKQRIVTITEYPDDPEKNAVELSNTTLTWEEYQSRLEAAAAAWEDVSNTDGSINGVYVHGVQSGDVVGVEVIVGGSGETYTGNLQQAVGQLQSYTNTRIGTVETTYLKATMANIDTANINTAKIKDLFVEVGLIRDAVISGARITGYLDAVEVNAASITAGTLVADRIAIRGSNTALVYALNNYGQLTSSEVNTIDGYILTDRTIEANKIVAHSITANEITANNIVGAGGWINLAQGTFNYGDALVWDGSNLTVSGTVAADSGKFGGWQATKYAMFADAGDVMVALQNAILYADISNCEISASAGQITIKAINSGDISMTGLRLMALEPYTTPHHFMLRVGISRTASTGDLTFTCDVLTQTNDVEGVSYTMTKTSAARYSLDVNYQYPYPDKTLGAVISYEATGCTAGEVHTIEFGMYKDSAGQQEVPLDWDVIAFKLPIGQVMAIQKNTKTLYSLGSNGDLMASRMTVEHPSYAQYHFNTPTRRATLQVNSSGTIGIWDRTNSAWVFSSDTSQDVTIPHLLKTRTFDTTSRPVVLGTDTDGYKILRMTAISSGLRVWAQWGTAGGGFTSQDFEYTGSDIRLKKNVKPSKVNALDLISKIKVREFDWKDQRRGHQRIGFIADELEKLDERLIFGGDIDDEGNPVMKSVSSFYLQGYIVKAIQELADKVNHIKGVR